jgi:hypothetical protein
MSLTKRTSADAVASVSAFTHVPINVIKQLMYLTGSIQLAEFRASPRAGICNNHLSNSTHSTRFAVRRGGNNINQQTDGGIEYSFRIGRNTFLKI